MYACISYNDKKAVKSYKQFIENNLTFEHCEVEALKLESILMLCNLPTIWKSKLTKSIIFEI